MPLPNYPPAGETGADQTTPARLVELISIHYLLPELLTPAIHVRWFFGSITTTTIIIRQPVSQKQAPPHQFPRISLQ